MFQKILVGFLFCFCVNLLAESNFISFQVRDTYANGNQVSNLEVKRIMRVLRGVKNAVIERNSDKLISFISKEKGAYLDVKGLWEYEKILEEAKKENSYFEIFFYDHEKLAKQKETDDVYTVRELLLKSEGIQVDLFFDSDSACEAKLIFKKNNKLEKDMNNPYLIKVNGQWFIYRFF